MSDKSKKYLNTFKTEEELKAYIEAQQQSFIEVSKKVKNLEDENEALNKKIEKLQLDQTKSKINDLEAQDVSNSEIICLSQIELLKKRTEERELTYEESKKFEIFTKIYQQIKTAKKSNDEDLKNKSTDELLRVISGGKDNE